MDARHSHSPEVALSASNRPLLQRVLMTYSESHIDTALRLRVTTDKSCYSFGRPLGRALGTIGRLSVRLSSVYCL